MNSLETNFKNWQEFNQNYLMSELKRISQRLEAKINNSNNLSVLPKNSFELNSSYPLPTLKYLAQKLNMSCFEQDILLLCAGMEFESNWGYLCAQAQKDEKKGYPTFSLALAVLENPCWEALTPTATLRKWQLIEVGGGNSLIHSPLRIDERILHYLAGINYLDENLIPYLQPITRETEIVPSHQQISQQIINNWANSKFSIIQLCGQDSTSKKAIAFSACQELGFNLQSISADTILNQNNQLSLIKFLCKREWILNNFVLFLDCHHIDYTEEKNIKFLIETIDCPLIISTQERYPEKERILITFDVAQPTRKEQRLIWHTALANTPISEDNIDFLITHFNLSLKDIYAACLQLKSLNYPKEKELLYNQLWNICRIQGRPRLDELGQQICSTSSWEDLILPEREGQILEEIAIHVREKTKIYEYWGFKKKSSRGLGISALFSGASGTGKTMAAEVLGNELQLDVYRIDLSSVVSKYIGETEKNLRRIFDAADNSGAILLFDEADALFGKRSEVKDSHDRYANMEVSYLLQRIETYQGLAILTTNLKNSLDQAFLRRIRFIVQFPFPDAVQREKIWKQIFPKEAPIQNLDFRKLANLNISGGNIRNISINAAFLAAHFREDIQMQHILQATKREYAKLERTLTDAETKEWLS